MFYLQGQQAKVMATTRTPGNAQLPTTKVNKEQKEPKDSKEAREPPKKKLILTDGWQMACTGICIYMFRLLPIE